MSKNPSQTSVAHFGRRFGNERLEYASPMTQLSRNLSGATLASVTKNPDRGRQLQKEDSVFFGDLDNDENDVDEVVTEAAPPSSSCSSSLMGEPEIFPCLDATPVLTKKPSSTKYAKVMCNSSSTSTSEDDDSPGDVRSPRKQLDFTESPEDCRKDDDIHEQMETSREELMMMEERDPEELSPECRALLSPRGPLSGGVGARYRAGLTPHQGGLGDAAGRCRAKRKFPGCTPSLVSQLSPVRFLAAASPRNSPTKRTRLSFLGQENACPSSSATAKIAAAILGASACRPPLRAIQARPGNANRGSGNVAKDFVFTPPVGLPPARRTGPGAGLSPGNAAGRSPLCCESPSSSSNDGYSELLTLDEDTNLPPTTDASFPGHSSSSSSSSLSSASSSSMLNISSLLKGSILNASLGGPNVRRDSGDAERMETDSDDVVVAVRRDGSTGSGRPRVPLRRALSYAGQRLSGTPVPKGGSGFGKGSKVLFGDLENDGSPMLSSKAACSSRAVNDENAPPPLAAAAVGNRSAHLQWDTESCPPPPSFKTRRLLLHSVSEESAAGGAGDADADSASADCSLTMPPDLSVLRDRSVNVGVGGCGGGVPLTHFRSESNIMARVYRRSTSDSHAIINRALKRSESRPNLIADCTRPYCLPIVTDGVKHPDLKNISPETLAKVLRGEYSNVIARFTVIDCRFPYEFEGGHIVGAVNVFTKDQILRDILPNEPCLPLPSCSSSGSGSVVGVGGGSAAGGNASGSGSDSTPDSSPDNDDKRAKERTILIFHCEFSSERGPTLARFLRSRDRGLNEENYPALHFPELYLLEGGYKAFYERYPAHCTPSAYRTMLDPNHAADLRHFKAKAKTWSGDPLATAAAKRPGAKGPACKKHL